MAVDGGTSGGPLAAAWSAAEGPGREASGPSTPAEEAWQADWALRGLPELQQLQSARRAPPPAGAPTMRSSQLDAGRLDEELTSMLREQFMRVFALSRPGLVSRLQPELALALDALIYRFSVWEGQPLPGMALMNLRHRSEWGVASSAGSSGGGGGGRSGVEGPGLGAAQRALYCLGAVLLRYGWTRLGTYAAAQHWRYAQEQEGGGGSDDGGDASGGSSGSGGWAGLRRRGWAAVQAVEAAYRLAALLNFLAFLRSGRYRSLLERVLGARLVYARPSAPRAISFEYLNRQLVWAELSELLLFVLPLVNGPAVRRAIRAALPRLPTLGAGGQAEKSGGGGGQLEDRSCGVCGAEAPLTAYAAVPCGHAFCYYCLRAECEADAEYACPRCRTRVAAMRRWAPPGG